MTLTSDCSINSSNGAVVARLRIRSVFEGLHFCQLIDYDIYLVYIFQLSQISQISYLNIEMRNLRKMENYCRNLYLRFTLVIVPASQYNHAGNRNTAHGFVR